jgi:alkyl hydroperoxide reductase subunit AhpF
MANHYISINRGKDGLRASDLTYATSSTAADDIELRIADAANLKRKDVILALEAFERALTTPSNTSTFPPL